MAFTWDSGERYIIYVRIIFYGNIIIAAARA